MQNLAGEIMTISLSVELDVLQTSLATSIRTACIHCMDVALPVATGAKFANHDLNVVVTGGDGDGYGIGGNHFLHTMRKNVDLLYIVMNNETYGLTVGQASPTTQVGELTNSTPFGNLETPLNPGCYGNCLWCYLCCKSIQC